MSSFNDFLEQGKKIQREYKQAKAAVEGDKMFSPEGKRQKIAALEQQRQQKASELQATAKSDLTSKRGGAQKLLEIGAEKTLAARIELFGRDGVLNMIRHSLENMTSKQIAAAHDEAATPFEREAIAIYGRSIVGGRANGHPGSENLGALSKLNEADSLQAKEVGQAKEWMAEVEDGLKRLDELDRKAYFQGVADATGTDVRYMDMD